MEGERQEGKGRHETRKTTTWLLARSNRRRLRTCTLLARSSTPRLEHVLPLQSYFARRATTKRPCLTQRPLQLSSEGTQNLRASPFVMRVFGVQYQQSMLRGPQRQEIDAKRQRPLEGAQNRQRLFSGFTIYSVPTLCIPSWGLRSTALHGQHGPSPRPGDQIERVATKVRRKRRAYVHLLHVSTPPLCTPPLEAERKPAKRPIQRNKVDTSQYQQKSAAHPGTVSLGRVARHHRAPPARVAVETVIPPPHPGLLFSSNVHPLMVIPEPIPPYTPPTRELRVNCN